MLNERYPLPTESSVHITMGRAVGILVWTGENITPARRSGQVAPSDGTNEGVRTDEYVLERIPRRIRALGRAVAGNHPIGGVSPVTRSGKVRRERGEWPSTESGGSIRGRRDIGGQLRVEKRVRICVRISQFSYKRMYY